MVSRKCSEVMYVTVLIQVNVIYSFLYVHGANLRPSRSIEELDTLREKLDATDYLIESLAIDICLNLQVYNKETSLEDCENNFLKSYGTKDFDPPEVHQRCQYGSVIGYQVEESQESAGWPLVVLTARNVTLSYLPYDLINKWDKNIRILELPKHDEYTAWTALLYKDGSHSFWRQGPEIRPSNFTGEVQQKKYYIDRKFTYTLVNESSTVNVSLTWRSFDDTDICFELVNSCDSQMNRFKIYSTETNGMNHGLVSQLPVGAACTLLLIGKHGSTKLHYLTPSCNDIPACIDNGRAHNISLVAEPGAVGWDIFVSWSRYHAPLYYNVTLLAENDTRSVQLPGSQTEMVFENVEISSNFYRVAIGSVHLKRTIWTQEKAVIPAESRRWGALGTALGGAWGALAGCGALLAALGALWRRRRERPPHAHYFPESIDKSPKDGDWDGANLESIVAEDDWELRSERLLLHEVIGEGAFGVVRRGTLTPAGKEVAVKMIKDFPTLDEIRSFHAEMELMKSVGVHPHIVSLVGCCSGRRPFIVAEYCSRGDLLSYLRCSWDVMVSKRNAKYYNNNIETTDYRNDLFKYKLQGEHSKLVVNKLYDLQGISDTDLTTRDLLSFCRQIAMGMEFLASNRLVHRDLAARNVLVSSDRTLKIADFGLSRDVYEENLYKQKGNGKMPMKWMALESLTRRIYTTQSDVWSFGVVMWEVASVGGSPYAEVPPARLPRLLRAGYRMPRPANCTKQLYEVMLSCWRAHPRERPTFVELHAQLDELLNSACAHDYLSLELDADDAPPALAPHKYVTMIIRDKLGWPRSDTYSRPMRTAQSNHYSSPPAYTHKVQSVS